MIFSAVDRQQFARSGAEIRNFRVSQENLKSHTIGGLRAIAIMEAAKGIIVLAVGFSLFAFVRTDVHTFNEQMVRQLHFNPAQHFPRIFGILSSGLTEANLRLVTLIAGLYSVMRFIEAYGLWFARTWAEWFALVSCCVYLPIELYELAKGFSWLKIGFLLVNLAIAFYLASVLRRNRKARHLVKEGRAG